MKKIPIRQLGAERHQEPVAGQFKIRKVEEFAGDTDLIHDLHRHDFFFILALKKGSGIHEIDFTPYNVLDHSVFFLRPGQVHQLHLKAGSSGYLIEFNTTFYHPKDKVSIERLRKASNKNFCELQIDRFNRILEVLASMYEEYREKEEGYQEVIKASLDIFFIEYVRQSPHPNKVVTTAASYTQERFEEFQELLDKHIATEKQVSQYTDRMSLSAYQLNEITKSSVGKTASDLINEHIILEAKRYLLATPNQVKDIADLLGYEDPSYFIRFFKKHTGHAPDAFRQHFK
jgi:AraC family transcriptional regulator, transcriptional activator of pobA